MRYVFIFLTIIYAGGEIKNNFKHDGENTSETEEIIPLV